MFLVCFFVGLVFVRFVFWLAVFVFGFVFLFFVCLLICSFVCLLVYICCLFSLGIVFLLCCLFVFVVVVVEYVHREKRKRCSNDSEKQFAVHKVLDLEVELSHNLNGAEAEVCANFFGVAAHALNIVEEEEEEGEGEGENEEAEGEESEKRKKTAVVDAKGKKRRVQSSSSSLSLSKSSVVAVLEHFDCIFHQFSLFRVCEEKENGGLKEIDAVLVSSSFSSFRPFGK